MYPVKQSTALTIPVFAHDASGDAVTGLVDAGFTKRISKNGGAFAAMTVTITEMENGWYSVPLSTAHTDTLGVLSITLTHASAKQVNLQFRVTAKLIDDLNDVAATDIVSSGAITTSAGAVSSVTTVATTTTNTDMRGTDNALLAASAPANFGDLSITVTTGLVDITQAAADKVWGSATRTLTAFSTSLALSVWDVLETAILTASSIGLKVKTNLDAAITSRQPSGAVDLNADQSGVTVGTVNALGATAKADVNAEVDSALDTAIPGVPTANSINERIAAIDDLTQAAGAGDLAAILTDTADMQPKLGTPAGADMSADIAAVQADTDDIQTRLPAALVSGKMDSDMTSIAGVAASATKLERGAKALVTGAAVGTPTTTVIDTDLTEATNDHYVGRIITFTTGNVAGQSTDITAYNGTTKELTVTALTDAPSAGHEFVIS